jgi:hypothetical protein
MWMDQHNRQSQVDQYGHIYAASTDSLACYLSPPSVTLDTLSRLNIAEIPLSAILPYY